MNRKEVSHNEIPPIPGAADLLLTTTPGSPGAFSSLLQGGFFFHTRRGITLNEMLCSLPGFDQDYINGRIQTIFIDGLPADHLNQTLIGTSAVIAISAAMPGLAGAIFRKNGVHASLRTSQESMQTISRNNDTDTPLLIQLKLFNIIAEEKSEQILRTGCTLSGSSLGKFFNYRLPLLTHIENCMFNGKKTSMEQLRPLLQTTEFIHLSLQEGS